MKKIIIIMLLLANTSLFAQKIADNKVPAGVRNTFKTSYPDVKKVGWEHEKGNYEANFNKDGKKMSVLMDAKGAILETETAISVMELPLSIIAYIDNKNKGSKIKEASVIILADGSMEYEANVKGKDLLFDKAGNFIKARKD